MKNDVEKKIKKLLDSMECPKGFRCAESGFKDLCKAHHVEGKYFLICDEECPRECVFSFAEDDTHLCLCPLRDYLAQNLGEGEE